MTYLILNLEFFLSIILLLPSKINLPPKRWWITLAIVLALTAIFDPIIIALDIVAYNPETLVGIYWFGAPIEDFFYAVFAAIAVPLAWKKLGGIGVKKAI